MERIWKPIIYNGMDLSEKFLVSNDGEICNKKTGNVLKQTLNKSTGYYGVCVSLGSRNKKKFLKTHVAVANAFLGERKYGMVVNHKDGNKENNNYTNLEWCTNKENSIHAVNIGLTQRAKKVLCVQTGEVFPSIEQAAKWCGLSENAGSLYEYFKKENRRTCGKHPVTKEKLEWVLLQS